MKDALDVWVEVVFAGIVGDVSEHIAVKFCLFWCETSDEVVSGFGRVFALRAVRRVCWLGGM